VDLLTGSLAGDATPAQRRKLIVALDLPAQAQPWARAQGLPLLADVSQNSGALGQAGDLVLLSPRPNATYRFDSNFDRSAQQLLVEAAAGQGISQVTLWVDGELLASFSAPPYQAWWPLAPGEHRFWAQGLSAEGESVTSEGVSVTVVADQ
jgi:hypothetical protein